MRQLMRLIPAVGRQARSQLRGVRRGFWGREKVCYLVSTLVKTSDLRQFSYERKSGDGRAGVSCSESHVNQQAQGKRLNLYEPAAPTGLLRADFSPWRPRDLTICTKSADTTAKLTIIPLSRGYIVPTRLITARFQLITQGGCGEGSKILGTSTPLTQVAC